MKLIYTHPAHILVAQARNSIEQAGIECIIRNEYAAGAIGELAPIDAWPELWVVRDRDFERATQIIEQSHTQVQEADWTCEKCDAANPATFDWCWQCARERGLPVRQEQLP